MPCLANESFLFGQIVVDDFSNFFLVIMGGIYIAGSESGYGAATKYMGRDEELIFFSIREANRSEDYLLRFDGSNGGVAVDGASFQFLRLE